jgi:hypothetical protein
MKFLLVGDLHFGKMSSIMGVDLALRKQTNSLQRQINIARSKGVRHGVLLGDTFDGPYPTLDEMIALIRVLSESKMEWLCYLGNHDIDNAENNSLKLLRELPAAGALRNVQFFDSPRRIEWCGMNAYVMPWAHRYKPIDSRDIDVVFFHDGLVGAHRDNGTLIAAGEGVAKSIFRGVTAISGHLHTPQKVGNIRFPGTAAQLTFGERPVKRLFFGEKTRAGIKIENMRFEPSWTLKKVTYDADNPPKCDEPNTYYCLNISKDRPGPRWMSDNPRVVKIEGSNRKLQRELVEKVIELTAGTQGVDSDSELLQRWLRAHTSLNKMERRSALKIDRDMGDSQ